MIIPVGARNDADLRFINGLGVVHGHGVHVLIRDGAAPDTERAHIHRRGCGGIDGERVN